MQNRPGTFHIFGNEVRAPPLDPALYLVATPIGNLGDVTLRALQTLAAADVIAAEDTRVSRVLLTHYCIRRKLMECHEHNEERAGGGLLDIVASGRSVALISDAGTPLISDPGYRIVRMAVTRNLPVVAIPGASALLAALTVSGLPTDSFLFAGFPLAKTGARRNRLAELATVNGALVFYESPRRLAGSLSAMAEIFGGDREAAVVRELTKRFEEFRRGRLAELAGHYEKEGSPRGEIVICVGPPSEAKAVSEGETDRLLLELSRFQSASRAAGEAAALTGRPKRELYRRLLALRDERQ